MTRSIAIAHVMGDGEGPSGVALCGKTLIARADDDYFVRDPIVLETVHNACQECRESPDYALILLGDLP